MQSWGHIPFSPATATAQPLWDLPSSSSLKWLKRPHGHLSATLLSLTRHSSTASTCRVWRPFPLPQVERYSAGLYRAEARDVAKHPIRYSSLIRSGTRASAETQEYQTSAQC